MRKGQKKKKDVMKLKDHAMVKFWSEDQSPLFNGENHEFIDSIFTRDSRLKNVRVQMRSMFDPVTTDCYTSYELSMVEPEVIEVPTLLLDPEKHPPYVYTGDDPSKEIPNDRDLSEPIGELIIGGAT